jgi:hypothetical protein
MGGAPAASAALSATVTPVCDNVYTYAAIRNVSLLEMWPAAAGIGVRDAPGCAIPSRITR